MLQRPEGTVSRRWWASTGETRGWAVENRMMMNVGKTDAPSVSAVRPKNTLVTRPIVPASVIDRGELITASPFVRLMYTLGIIFDIKPKNGQAHWRPSTARIPRTSRICKIRKYLDRDTTAHLVVAFVLSLLDNGNSLLSDLLACQINRLQLVQNSDFKAATLAYRCGYALAPSYLAELVSLQVPRCVGLCSQADDLKLVVPPPRMETRGERAFSSYAPRICNNLPLTLRSLSSLSSFRRSSINIFLNLLSNNRMCVPPPKRRLTITYNYYYYYKQLNSSKCCIWSIG